MGKTALVALGAAAMAIASGISQRTSPLDLTRAERVTIRVNGYGRTAEPGIGRGPAEAGQIAPMAPALNLFAPHLTVEIGRAPTFPIAKLPNWLRIYRLDLQQQPDFAKIEAAFCTKPGWKILVANDPIYSSGPLGDSRANKRLLEPVLRKCGVQLLVVAGDSHQEHLSASTYEQIVQGSTQYSRGVDQRLYKPGDQVRQRFARQQNGHAAIEATPEKITLRFYDEKSSEIYFWSAGPSRIGLVGIMPTRLSAEQAAADFGTD